MAEYRHTYPEIGSGDAVFWRTHFAGLELKDYEETRNEMLKLNDRSLVVLALSLLQFRVNDSLKWHFEVGHDDKVLNGLIGGGDSAGYLGFKYQCHLLYAMGVVGPASLKDLTTIARVRNRFAHTFAPLTFADQSISDLCLSLARHDEGVGILFTGGIEDTDEAREEFYRQYDKDPKTRFVQTFHRFDNLLHLDAFSERERREKHPFLKYNSARFMVPKQD